MKSKMALLLVETENFDFPFLFLSHPRICMMVDDKDPVTENKTKQKSKNKNKNKTKQRNKKHSLLELSSKAYFFLNIIKIT